ncbi:MAG: diguanylate cyclase (GGDEF)-like protein [Phenylobacterium sp.]
MSAYLSDLPLSLGLLLGLGLGLVLGLVLACGVLYRVSSNRKYILLGLSFSAQMLALVSVLLVDPQGPWWLQHSPGLWLVLSLVCGILFAQAFLPLRKLNVKVLQLLRILVGVGGVTLLLELFVLSTYVTSDIGLQVLLVYALVVATTLSATGIRCWQHKADGAELFTISWMITLLSVVIIGLGWHWNMLIISAMCSVTLSAALLFIALTKQAIGEKTNQIGTLQQAINDIRTHQKNQQQQFTEQEEEREELEASIQTRNFELEVTLRELEDKNRELEEKNTQDALTGIRNRRYFDKKYLAEFRRSRREQTELSVVMLDIDHFKAVNDNHGHLAGDDVIRFVGRTMQDLIKRPTDDVCRYGGEEFTLILPSTDIDGARQVAETIRQTIADAVIETQNGALSITISCGICTSIADSSMAANHYIEMADKSLYMAKEQGRNCVIHSDDALA